MRWPLYIALRYLFAKKSYNVINIISLISAIGICVGSMALIIILSVYNGFDNIIKSVYESYEADFLISPTEGKRIKIDQLNIDELLHNCPSISSIAPIVEDNIFVKYGEIQSFATIKGIDSNYIKSSSLNNNIKEGELKLSFGEINYAFVGENLSRKLKLKTSFSTPLELFYPKNNSELSILFPLASLNYQKLYPSSIVKHQNDRLENLLYANIEIARALLEQRDNECSYLEIYIAKEIKINTREFKKIEQAIKNHFKESNLLVKNKQEQNALLYKMIKAEKLALYLILFFVILILSINIFCSLSMLIIEKQEDRKTLLSLGVEPAMLQKIFSLQGFLISAIGGFIGILLGTLISYLQLRFKLIYIPGNYLVSTYPIDIKVVDIILTYCIILFIGFIVSYIPAKKLLKSKS